MAESGRRPGAPPRVRPLTVPRAPGAITRLAIPAGVGLPSPAEAVAALAVAESVRVPVRARLARASLSGRIDRMLDAIDGAAADCVALYENALAAALAANPPYRDEMKRIACRRGCAFCCHVDVAVTPLEAIRLARLSRHAAAAGIGVAARADAAAAPRFRPCPLLKDGACSVYDARPFACRALYSFDAAACETGFTTGARTPVPSLDWPRFLSCGYVTGELAALVDLGLAGHLVNLRAALAVMQADTHALPHWLNGTDVFAPSGTRGAG